MNKTQLFTSIEIAKKYPKKLQDCYARQSNAKEHLYYSLIREYALNNNNKCLSYFIVSFNIRIFTIAFEYKDYYLYITPTKQLKLFK